VTGLASNPTIFNHAIKNSAVYSSPIRRKLAEGKSTEALFFELALEDLTRAADPLRPIFDRTNGVDGWVSLEVSPLPAYDTAETWYTLQRSARTLLVGAETRSDISCFDTDDFAFPQVSKERRIGCEETSKNYKQA
jgi:Transaldolase/Fructose-6-phosphate aldolase